MCLWGFFFLGTRGGLEERLIGDLDRGLKIGVFGGREGTRDVVGGYHVRS